MLKPWLIKLKQTTYNTTFMYNIRMLIVFAGTAFLPYFMGEQLATIPLALGAVAAGLSDIDDRFSVRIVNSALYLYWFLCHCDINLVFISSSPAFWLTGSILSCIALILLGSLGRRYASISYGCLVVSVYSMLGVELYLMTWYTQALLPLVSGAIWYGLLSTISFLLFPVLCLTVDKLAQCYNFFGDFLFAKSNLFDVDMTAPSYQKSIIDLSLENGKLIGIFNDMKTALLTRLKGDRGQKDTRRSLQILLCRTRHSRTCRLCTY